MHTICHNNIIYFYRNADHAINSFVGSGITHRMMNAEYAVQLDPTSELDLCTVVKDRSGIFSKSTSLPLKKVLKIVNLLMED